MKALSGYPQWFWLLAKNWKNVENRNWPTKLRGRIYLHGSKTWDTSSSTFAFIRAHLSPQRWDEFIKVDWGRYTGAIIGEIDIIGCVTREDAHYVAGHSDELRFNAERFAGKAGFGKLVFTKWFVGKYGLLVADGILYDEPIPCRGWPMFFEPTFEQQNNIIKGGKHGR